MTFLLHFVNLYATFLLGQLKSKDKRTAERDLSSQEKNKNTIGRERILLNIFK